MATTRVDLAIENSAERVWNVVGDVEPGQLTMAANYVIGCQARHGIRTVASTGPQLLTLADAPAELSAATGRRTVYQPVSLTDYLTEGRRLRLPEERQAAYAHVFTETSDGRNVYTTDGIQQGLGRPYGTVADCAGPTAGTGVWQVAA
jgi:uncharacterized protein YbjT (DUF2867 family)